VAEVCGRNGCILPHHAFAGSNSAARARADPAASVDIAEPTAIPHKTASINSGLQRCHTTFCSLPDVPKLLLMSKKVSFTHFSKSANGWLPCTARVMRSAV
jgi:hypothetical protein